MQHGLEKFDSLVNEPKSVCTYLLGRISTKSGKHQKSRQRQQDLRLTVQYRAQFFVLRSYTMHDLRNFY